MVSSLSTVIIWLLITPGNFQSNRPVVPIERFANQSECERAKDKIYKISPVGLACVEVTALRTW